MAPTRFSNTRQAGFSLLEVLITLILVGTVAMIATPSIVQIMRKNRIATAGNNFIAALSLARQQGLTTHINGSICATTDGIDCNTASTPDWAQGWLVWSDTNTDGEIDDDEQIVRVQDALPSVTLIPTSNVGRISFNGQGLPATTATVTFNLRPSVCPSGKPEARTLTFLVSGLIRSATVNCP